MVNIAKEASKIAESLILTKRIFLQGQTVYILSHAVKMLLMGFQSKRRVDELTKNCFCDLRITGRPMFYLTQLVYYLLQLRESNIALFAYFAIWGQIRESSLIWSNGYSVTSVFQMTQREIYLIKVYATTFLETYTYVNVVKMSAR